MQSEFRADHFEVHRGGRFGAPLRVYAETTSTNADALEWATEGAPEGAVVVADAQTAGRGRWGRTWIDVPKESLLFSLVLRPTFRPSLLTTALGVALCAAVEVTTGAAARIKWPNDVTIDGLKVAGILVEARVGGAEGDAVVAGVGVNLSWREVPSLLAGRATSLWLATGRAPDGELLLAAILRELEPRYDALAAGDRAVLAEAAARSETIGRAVRATTPGGAAIVGYATRLSESGALVIDTEDGLVTLDAGEVQTLRGGPDAAD